MQTQWKQCFVLMQCVVPRADLMCSYLEKLEADRQAQHSGYGVQQYLCADGSQKWEAYGWERITELSIHTTSYGIFDHKWQAEQYFNSIING
jgi:hypothetical protein